MGYTINIGNAELEADFHDENYDEPHAEWLVKMAERKEAPEFSDSAKRNSRWPSYTVWCDFARAVGLYEFFFDKENGKMRRHPGTQRLTKGDAALVTAALVRYRETHPTSTATFCECGTCDVMGKWDRERKGETEGPTHDPHADGNLVRLTWLEWWVRWAVENCERPAIYNS